MATIDSLKKALKSTTKMSLNQRFQLLRQNQLRRQTNPLNSNKMVQNNTIRHQLREGSQKNRRLALQMANRPSVLAALRTQNQNSQTTRPVKQRLGIKRFNNQNNAFNANRNPNKRRINRLNFNINGMNRNMTQNRRNNSQNIGVIVGVRRKGIEPLAALQRQSYNQLSISGLQRNRLRLNQTIKTQNVTSFKGKRRIGPQIRNQNQAKIGNKKRFRLNRNFIPRNNSGKQQNQQKRRNIKPNREQLDNDLDAYMSGTKTNLDHELDAYMSQTN